MRGPQDTDLPAPTPSTCGQCGHRFPYLEDVGLEIAEYILEQHSQLCVRSSSQKHAQVALWPDTSGSSDINASSTIDQVGSQGGAVASETLDTVRKRRKYETDMMGRKAVLEADPYGREVTAKSIVCNGCDKTIRLDRRNDYYPGLWVKHRDKCRARVQPPKRTARETAKEVVWGEKAGVGGKRRATTHARIAKPGTLLRARTLSPIQAQSFEPSTRPRSWSGVSVSGNSLRPILIEGQVENVLGMGPLSTQTPPMDNFKEKESFWPVPKTAAPQVHHKLVGISRPSHVEAVPFLEVDNLPEITKLRSPSIDSSTDTLSMDSEPITHVDTAHHTPLNGSNKARIPHSFSLTEDGDGDEDVKSDRYWSEAPFATGSDQWAERGRYRYSTRRELMRVFHHHRNKVKEDMPPASPLSSFDGHSSPGNTEFVKTIQ